MIFPYMSCMLYDLNFNRLTAHGNTGSFIENAQGLISDRHDLFPFQRKDTYGPIYHYILYRQLQQSTKKL